MINRDDSKNAEIMDQVSRRMAVGFMVAGISYMYEIINFFYNSTKIESVQIIGYGLTISAVLIILWALIPEIKGKLGGKKYVSDDMQSFISESINFSFKISWIATMGILAIFMFMENYLVGLSIPLIYYFKFLFGFMVLVASVSFFYVSRSIADEFEGGLNE
jgi:hypothetical protein